MDSDKLLVNSYSYLAIPPTLRLEPSSKRMLGTVENMKLFILIARDHYQSAAGNVGR